MPTCDYCGAAVDTPFECEHCKASHCSEHRLPEQHGCPFAGVIESPSDNTTSKYGHRVYPGGNSGVEAPEPMDLSDRAKPSGVSDSDPPTDSSPKVRLKTDTSESRSGGTTTKRTATDSTTNDMQINTSVYAVKATGVARNLIRFAGLILVILPAYNLLVAPFFAAPAYAPYRVMLAPLFAGGGFLLSDILLMAVGAMMTWFV